MTNRGAEFTADAVRDMQRLSGSDQRLILAGIRLCRDSPWTAKELKNKSLCGMFRRRVELASGSYRIVFDMPAPSKIRVIAVGDRGTVYPVAETRALALARQAEELAGWGNLRTENNHWRRKEEGELLADIQSVRATWEALSEDVRARLLVDLEAYRPLLEGDPNECSIVWELPRDAIEVAPGVYQVAA